jgi:hypothetical protein
MDIPLYQETLDWLLASRTPSIRYLALTRLAGERETSAAAAAARAEIAGQDPGAYILAQQGEGGHWNNPKHYYSPKFTSSHWSMLLLNELALDPAHPAMQAGADHMLRMLDADIAAYRPGGQLLWICLLGNWLRYQLYCGRLADERVQTVIEYICEDVARGCVCHWNQDLPCAWGVARSLFGLALIPAGSRAPAVNSALEAGIDFLINQHRLEKADYPDKTRKHALWSKTSFPLFYQADILFTLRVLKELGAHTLPGAQPARHWLLERRTSRGTWRGSSPFAKRTRPIDVEEGAASRWVTLHALEVLAG